MASGTENKRRFTLIELIMVIMAVAIVVTFVIPLQQAKKREGWTKEAVGVIQQIATKDAEYKTRTGHYAPSIDSLQIQPQSEFFTFSVTSETIIGATTKAFGVEGVELRFELPNGPWHRQSKENRDKFAIQPNWLPE
jgi:type II secretory pathway pseudopilin PulG